MLGIKDLLLNFLFVILPIFLYQVFWVDKQQGNSRRICSLLICVLSCISVFLCMTFPFTLLPGYIFDMRPVPVLIGTLYGGYESCIAIFAVLIGYRYYLGGSGFYTTLETYALAALVSVLLARRFDSYSRIKKINYALLLAFLTSFIIVLVIYFKEPAFAAAQQQFFDFAFNYCFINVGGMWFAVYLIENMKKNMELQREINRTEKLHVMGELAAAVAHEIRNPMTVVRGFMQLLHQEQIEEHKKRMYTELMIGELDRAQEIIDDYLTFAKPEAKHREEIDAGVEVQNAVNVMTSYALLKNVEAITGIDHGLFVYLESSKFRQCLVNLIKNGIEAMPEGGALQVYAYRSGNSVVVDIIDEGIGMSPEEVSRLGSPFYSTKEKGTGLGLMVCYRIIELFNGKIHVRSEQGKGTAFSILLPASLEKK